MLDFRILREQDFLAAFGNIW